MNPTQLFDPASSTYTYILFDEDSREAVIIDDVFTTGATAEACAHALKEGGAERVAFLSIAAD